MVDKIELKRDDEVEMNVVELQSHPKRLKIPRLTCRDVSELVMDQIELYRDTKESIMRGRDAVAWEGMSQVIICLFQVRQT